jgi:hypothetical protein
VSLSLPLATPIEQNTQQEKSSRRRSVYNNRGPASRLRCSNRKPRKRKKRKLKDE